MLPTLLAASAGPTDIDAARVLLLALFAGVLVASINPGNNPGAMNGRSAPDGPLPAATSRDYVLLTLLFGLALACLFVGLWFMNH